MLGLNSFSAAQIQTFLLIFVRTTAIITLLPIFGTRDVPVRLKVGLSAFLSILLVQYTEVETGVFAGGFTIPGFMVLILREVFIGLTIGYAASLLFAAVQFAGRLIDTQMGFAMVQLVDPFTDTRTTVAGQVQVIVYSLVFLVLNCHYFMILAIQKSFELIPLLGAEFASGGIAEYMTDLTAAIFVTAIRLAAPVFSVLVLASLSLGIVARTVPQINIFFVGLPMKIMLGLGTLAVAFPVMAKVFRGMVDTLVKDIWNLLYIMA